MCLYLESHVLTKGFLLILLPSIYNLVLFKFRLAENFCCFFNISEAYMLTIYILFE
jgi:hypothetical protein